MAAPHVTGTIALMQECLGERIGIADMRALLFASLMRADLADTDKRARDLHRVGYGVLDIAAAERVARSWRDQRIQPKDRTMDHQTEDIVAHEAKVSVPPGVVADHSDNDLPDILLDDEDDGVDADVGASEAVSEGWEDATEDLVPAGESVWPWDDVEDTGGDAGDVDEVALEPEIDDAPPAPRFAVNAPVSRSDLLRVAQASVPLARSREFLANRVQQGDVVHTGYGDRLAMVTGEEPENADALWRRGVPVAWSGSGAYVEVLEDTAEGSLRPVGRRLTDSSGRLARGTSLWRPGQGIDELERPAVDQADPWCQRREDIARIALQEERDWTRPDGRKRVESERGRLPALVRYWSATPGFRAPAKAQRAARCSAIDHKDYPWSAAFICFVMNSAGIRRADGFEFGSKHIRYIVGALRNRERNDRTRPFWLVDAIELVNEVRLAPGDLICFNRLVKRNGRNVWTAHSYESLGRKFYLNGNRNVQPYGHSHTSLVVGTERRNGRDFVQTLGGNEGHSVRLRRIPINAGGGIDNPAARRIFGAVKLTRC